MEEKPPKKGLLSSLAARIFLINAVILVLPLWVHSVTSYRKEYEIRKSDAFFSLNMAAENRASLIKDLFRSQEKILDVVKLKKNFLQMIEKKGFNPFFQKIVEISNASNLFYLEKKRDGSLECISFVSRPEKIPEDAKDLLDQPHFSYTEFRPSLGGAFFYVGSSVVDENNEVLGYLIIANAAEKMIQGIAKERETSPLTLSYISEGNTIVASSNRKLVGLLVNEPSKKNRSISLKRERGIKNGYIFRKNRLAVKFTIPAAEGYLLLDLPEKEVKDLQIRQYVERLFRLFFLIGILGGALTILCIIRMAKPMKRLLYIMDLVESGKKTIRYKKDAFGFEINRLGYRFNQMMDAVIEEGKKKEEERLAKEIYQKELLLGHQIQESLLKCSIDPKKIDAATYYEAAKEVGGDFFDLYLLDEKTLYLSIADVSGKGVSACLYSLGLRSSLRSSISSGRLKESVEKANHLFFVDAVETSMFASMWAGVYDLSKKSLHFINAGHLPALLRKETGEVLFLDTKNPSIGIEHPYTFSKGSTQLEKGDTLVLYSDGIIETRSKEGIFYGKNRLEKALQNTKGLLAEEILDEILQDFSDFKKGEKNEDDVTLVVLKI